MESLKNTPGQQNQFNDPFNQNINGGNLPVPNSAAVLVLGIISIASCWCYGIIGLASGIVALVLASNSFKTYKANPNAYSQAS